MINIVHNEKTYQVRNLGTEVNLNELARISFIMENEKSTFFDRWLEVIEVVGSKELANVIDEDALFGVIENMQLTNIENAIMERIEVNGRGYVCRLEEGKLKLSGKDLSAIERCVRTGGIWGNKAFAVVYKDEQLGINEHYVDAHIKHKSELFGKEVTADVAAPVVFQLSQKIIGHLGRLANVDRKAVS